MGTFKEEITLENLTDWGLAEHGYIEEAQIRRLTVEAMPDTGAWTLVINEDTREKLGLTIKGSVKSSLADGKASTYPVTESVKIQWKDRNTELPAWLLPRQKTYCWGHCRLRRWI